MCKVPKKSKNLIVASLFTLPFFTLPSFLLKCTGEKKKTKLSFHLQAKKGFVMGDPRVI